MQLQVFHLYKEDNMEFSHIPVLLEETIEGLDIKENGKRLSLKEQQQYVKR